MRVAVSFDQDGDVLLLFDPDKVGNADMTISYVPGEGEHHHVFELPKELEQRKFTELHKMLRVKVGEHPTLEVVKPHS
jgi:hypothetical protein